MSSSTTMEELARIAGVKSDTVRRTARELLELLERDLRSQGMAVSGVEES